jgi:phage/plasmid-like protein (TIGR03299 family)
MAHAITNTNGFNEMAFVGETPWHGLGQSLEQGQPLEVWAKAAGMEWRVQRSKVYYATERGQDHSKHAEWADRHVLMRSDNKAPLGLVSDGYKVVQPIEVLQFFSEVSKANHLEMETAGTLNGGKQYWALARTGESFALGGVDRINAYVMLATSCDGSMATTAKFTSVRVVCANTLAMARSDGKSAIKVKHSTTFNADQVRIDLGLAASTWEEFKVNAARLASRRLTKQDCVSILVKSIGDEEAFRKAFEDKKTTQEALQEQPNIRVMTSIMELFNGRGMGAQAVTANGTAWGLVNAATQYFDHDAGRSPDTRLNSAWFGINADRKQSILDESLALCE